MSTGHHRTPRHRWQQQQRRTHGGDQDQRGQHATLNTQHAAGAAAQSGTQRETNPTASMLSPRRIRIEVHAGVSFRAFLCTDSMSHNTGYVTLSQERDHGPRSAHARSVICPWMTHAVHD